MKKTASLLLSSAFLFVGCVNKKEGSLSTESTTQNSEQMTANQEFNSYKLKLNTIEGESGLENYSTDGKEVYGSIIKQLQGSDGSEYYLLKLDKSLAYSESESTPIQHTDYLIVGGRFQGAPLQKGANKTVVNVAIVKDHTVATDAQLDFEKAIFAGMGEATEVQ